MFIVVHLSYIGLVYICMVTSDHWQTKRSRIMRT